MKRTFAIVCAASLMAPVLLAQDQDQDAAKRRALETTLAANAASLRVALETRVTRGKPYSGEAVNEFVQVLGDGNRIVRRSSARVFRDSDGRTRREELGDNNATPKNGVTISDPVAGVSFILDVISRTAIKTPGMFARVEGGSYSITSRGTGGAVAGGFGGARGGGAGETRVQVFTTPEQRAELETKAAAAAEAAAASRQATVAVAAGRSGSIMVAGPAVGETTKEDLGQQNIEGVTATGTRTTTVIPAGTLGNEQPITVVSEQWFSSDLDALVLTKHSDPRVGETTYKLINISRTEPDRTLFQVPSDYTVQERAVLRRQQQQQ